MTDTADYPRRTLLAVTGLSPQIVTETLFALAIQREPPFIPTDIQLVTTSEGAERARLSLLSDEPGWFARLLRDYRLPEIAFDDTHIHVLEDAQANALDDIRHIADNEQAADSITEHVRKLTATPDCALHVSIAGGRKTMGYYLGYALSLFGRPQDRLSHVLVAEPFESSWDFFYPTPYSRVITTRDNKLADTAQARVTLAEIPFVRLRDGLPERLLEGKASFGETVAAAQRALEPPDLVIHLAGQRIEAGGESVPLTPASLAFYSVMARRKRQGREPVRWDTDGLAEHYQRRLQAGNLLREIADEHASGDLPLVDNIELLFDASLAINPLDPLKRLAHARRVVAAWPGEHRQGGGAPRLTYAATSHPEHRDYSLDGVVPFYIQT